MSEATERELFEAELQRMPEWAPEFEQHRAWVELFAWNLWKARAARSQQSEVADAARVIAWATDPNRKRANLAFTAGPERQAAYWIEWAQQEWMPISSAPKEGDACKHYWLRAWRDAKTGETVPLWSCVDCNRRFEPVPAQPVEAPQGDGNV